MLKKKECKINKNEHLNSLNIGNNNISILLKNILRLYNNNIVVNDNQLKFYLSRSTRIYISTLNEYFKKKIYMDENKENQKRKIQNIRDSIKNKTHYLQNKKDKKKYLL